MPGRRSPDHHADVCTFITSTSSWSTSRDRIREALAEGGVDTGIHYPVPLHLTPAYRSLGYVRRDFPAAEALAKRSISLPMHPHLSSAQTEYVVEQLARAVE